MTIESWHTREAKLLLSLYRGLKPLEADDAGIFFGREAPTRQVGAVAFGERHTPPTCTIKYIITTTAM